MVSFTPFISNPGAHFGTIPAELPVETAEADAPKEHRVRLAARDKSPVVKAAAVAKAPAAKKAATVPAAKPTVPDLQPIKEETS